MMQINLLFYVCRFTITLNDLADNYVSVKQ